MSDLLENMQFQIVSSSSLLSFHQARFSLLDTVSANLGYTFGDSSKALILTLFDNILLWNHEVYLALKASEDNNDYVTDSLISSFRSTIVSSLDQFQKKYNFLAGQAAVLFMVVTSKYHELLEKKLRSVFNANRILAFSDLNNFLVKYMDHVFRFIHELDYVINAQRAREEFEPFLSVDELDLQFYTESKVSTTAIRLTAYKETKLLKESDICIKLYVDKNLLDSDQKMNSAFESILGSIENQGMNIICIL